MLLAGQWEGLTQADQVQGLAVTTDHQPFTTVRISYAGAHCIEQDLTSAGLWCPLSLPLVCVTCGGGWVVVL